MKNAVKKILKLETDFEEQSGHFSPDLFPENRLVSTIGEDRPLSMEDKMRLASAFCMLDYNRDANNLADNLIELYERDRFMFSPYSVPDAEDRIASLFEEIGFRYPNRDAHAWVVNNGIVAETYHGMWTELVVSTRLDAPALVEQVRDDGFLCLKGVKIAPMYARIVSDTVVRLDNLWELDIPVDTHIRRLSKDLLEDDDLTDDEIRRAWHRLGEMIDINPHLVDGALWMIGNQWDDWGEEYWNSL